MRWLWLFVKEVPQHLPSQDSVTWSRGFKQLWKCVLQLGIWPPLMQLGTVSKEEREAGPWLESHSVAMSPGHTMHLLSLRIPHPHTWDDNCSYIVSCPAD